MRGVASSHIARGRRATTVMPARVCRDRCNPLRLHHATTFAGLIQSIGENNQCKTKNKGPPFRGAFEPLACSPMR